MRLKLVFAVDKHFNRLPLNYFYPMSSAIYKLLHYGNPEFAQWLHQSGYNIKGKSFKHFTYSKVYLRNFKRIEDSLLIFDHTVTFYVSFLPKRGIEGFVLGLFRDAKIEISDGKNKCIFYVEKVNALPEPEFKETMTFRATSPICLSRPAANGYKEFLHPSHPEYGERFFENLMFKFLSYKGIEPQYFNDPLNSEYRFRYYEPCKSRLAAIKQGTPEETKVRGYFYTFEITAPKELLRIGYYSGFGEKNSLGFGYAEVVNKT